PGTAVGVRGSPGVCAHGAPHLRRDPGLRRETAKTPSALTLDPGLRRDTAKTPSALTLDPGLRRDTAKTPSALTLDPGLRRDTAKTPSLPNCWGGSCGGRARP